MRIDVPVNFKHPGELDHRYTSRDPRESDFTEAEVEVDLRRCDFVWPAAVLWCVVYLSLVRLRGAACELLVPGNMGVCIHLKALGLFDILKGVGVKVDDRGVYLRQESQVVLPLENFHTVSEVDVLANKALDNLQRSGLGAANIRPVVSEAFAELALNAAQHAHSPFGAYGLIQFYQGKAGTRFVCGVSDGGIGIRRSLEQNPALKPRIHYDWDAIELAVRERVSGTGDPTRGIGLYGVVDEMRRPGRQMSIHSGLGYLSLSDRVGFRAERTKLFLGTLAYVAIPT